MELIKNSAADCYPIVQRTTMLILQKLESLLGIEDALVSAADRNQLNKAPVDEQNLLQS